MLSNSYQKIQIFILLTQNSQKFQLDKVPLTYDQLIEVIKDKSTEKNIQNIIIKYKDCDNDIITIQNTKDLETAYDYVAEELQEQLTLIASFELDENSKNNENQKIKNIEKFSLTEQSFLKQFCECFKQIELCKQQIFVECSKCKYYKEGINCSKCQGSKKINPSEKECNLINAILNYKIEKTFQVFVSEKKEQIDVQNFNFVPKESQSIIPQNNQIKTIQPEEDKHEQIENNPSLTEVEFQQIKFKLLKNPNPCLFKIAPSDAISSILTIQNLSPFNLQNAKITCIQGFPLSQQIVLNEFKIEEKKQIQIEFKAPQQEGLYLSCWKLEVEGKLLGPKIVLEINVKEIDKKMAQSQILCYQVQI